MPTESDRIPWILISGLTSIYWGLSKNFTPSMKVEDLKKDAVEIAAGTHVINKMDKGLSVELKERTVMEFFNKKYLFRNINFYIKPGRESTAPECTYRPTLWPT